MTSLKSAEAITSEATTPTPVPSVKGDGEKGAGGQEAPPGTTFAPPAKEEHWLRRTEQHLPKNNLVVVFTGLMLTVFLCV